MAKKMAIPRPPSISSARIAPPPVIVRKHFKIEKWDGSKGGKKILLYADSGMGKTTLATMLPKPVFIGLDDGGREIHHPVTGEMLDHIPGVSSFADVRSALQADIYADYETVVIDTVTLLEELAVQFVLDTISNDKGGKVDNIVRYGYNKGYRHLYDVMKLPLQDCDSLVASGKNVVLIAQSAALKVANALGDDYLRESPRLYAGSPSVEAMYCEWADHIFRIGYRNIAVDDKKAASDGQRAVFVHGQAHFRAKSRTLGMDKAVVSFEEPADDSIWQFVFGEAA
jgi:hypothetical protein